MQPNFASPKRQKLNAAKIVCLTLYTVAHNLMTQNIILITSERNELGASNLTDLYCNKLTMYLSSFMKFHSVVQKM